MSSFLSEIAGMVRPIAYFYQSLKYKRRLYITRWRLFKIDPLEAALMESKSKEVPFKFPKLLFIF